VDKFNSFFLSLGPEQQIGVFLLSVCTVHCGISLLCSCLDWLFHKPASQEKKAAPVEAPWAWHVCVAFPLKSYEEVVVLPDSVDPRSVGGSEAYIIEGPFDVLDEAIARKDELKKKL